MRIVSFSGRIGSGKDTAAQLLIDEFNFTKISFADSVKDALSVIFGWDREMLGGTTTESRINREQVDEWWAERLGIPHLSPRWAMQHFGTDICRKHFHPDIWIASLEKKITTLDSDLVISDARFINELTMLTSLGATTIMVDRLPIPDWWEVAKQAYYDPVAVKTLHALGIHRTEWEWANYPFDYRIDNNGSIDELRAAVRLIVQP